MGFNPLTVQRFGIYKTGAAPRYTLSLWSEHSILGPFSSSQVIFHPNLIYLESPIGFLQQQTSV